MSDRHTIPVYSDGTNLTLQGPPSAVLGNLSAENLSPQADIMGYQLAANANIAGSQLSPSAAIAAGQIASVTPSTLTGTGTLPPAAVGMTTEGDMIYQHSGGVQNLASGTTGQFLESNGTDPQWHILAATDIPNLDAGHITSGTLAVAQGGTATATANANTAFAGPTSGASAAPGFRALVAADIPNLPASQITSGQLALAQGGTAVDNTAAALNSVFAGPGSGGAGNATFRALVAADIPNLPASQITSGTLAVAQGGTGVGTASANQVFAAPPTASGSPAFRLFPPQSTFSGLPSASTAGSGTIYLVTDIGSGGTLFISNGSIWRPVNGHCVLASSGVKIQAANTTGWQAYYSYTLPQNIMTLNGRLRITAQWTTVSNTNTKTLGMFLGAGLIGGAFVIRRRWIT